MAEAIRYAPTGDHEDLWGLCRSGLDEIGRVVVGQPQIQS